MIVSNAYIGMVSQQEYHQESRIKEAVGFLVEAPPLPSTPVSGEPVAEVPAAAVDLSAAGSLLAMHRQQETVNLAVKMDARSRLNMMIIAAMYKNITGREMQIADPASVQAVASGRVQTLDISTPAATQGAVRTTGAALVYHRQEHYREHERMQFKAEGMIRTADGREIAFSVDIAMSRKFAQESNITMPVENQKIDPLVINFDGKGASLSQHRFAFDLDADGTAEQIASLRPGSGYLALDRNGDGVINDGSELFGPGSGRGFEELAQYDEDGNFFIDEGDSVYHQLRIWMTNEDGTSQLAGLGDMNIGAIFLGHVSSPFQLKDAQNNSLGEVANSGIYLTEEGKVGVIQEINLTV